MTSPSFAAVDLGAESGRVILGKLKKEKLSIQEIHRFPNGGVRVGNHLHWDILRLWYEIQAGLSKAGNQSGDTLRSIGLDTWGVDFGLLDSKDNLIGNPYHYRDARTDDIMDVVFEKIPRAEIYHQTGIQFMQFNSLFQLFAMLQAQDPTLSIAKTFLNIPDLFNFFLTGVKASELTVVSTTQCYDPVQRSWAFDLLDSLEIPTQIFKAIVPPGTVLGALRPDLGTSIGLENVKVVASAGHDTASAVAAVPASTQDYIYLSSGTWSLIGVELDSPLINAESLAANLTNEGGFGNKIRFLKNIVGMWLLQECRRQWQEQGFDYDYQTLSDIAAEAPAFGPLIDPSDGRFLAPDDMVVAIQTYCQETGQGMPLEHGKIVRCVLESLALEYRWVAEQIDQLVGKKHPVIHIIGGGSQNRLLNQLTANATNRTVIAGPVEATAIGNILVQAIAMGEIGSITEGREIVCQSFPVVSFEPENTAAWDETYARFIQLKEVKK